MQRLPSRARTALGQFLREIPVITRNSARYLDVLVLLRQDVAGKDLVDGDPFRICPGVPCKRKAPSKRSGAGRILASTRAPR